MLRLFLIVLSLAMMLSPLNLQEMEDAAMFYAYNNGKEIVVTQENKNQIEKILCDTLKGARRVPALGVSLHDETVEAVKQGLWIRFKFDRTFEIDGMPFDDLLVELRQEMYGANVIRGNNGRYEGRCFYIDLNKNCNELYAYLLSLPVSKENFEIECNKTEPDGASQTVLRLLQDEDIFSQRGKKAIPLKHIQKS